MTAAQHTPTPEVRSLKQLAIGSRAKITKIKANRFIVRRLLGLGLRVGSVISVLHHRGKGVVIAAGGNRIALGEGVTEKLQIELLGAIEP